MSDHLVHVWCDFNDILTRVDGVQEVDTKYVEGVELRQPVYLHDEDCFVIGVVSGIKDYGRGRFLSVEMPKDVMWEEMPKDVMWE